MFAAGAVGTIAGLDRQADWPHVIGRMSID
jgi:hypothetical protein